VDVNFQATGSATDIQADDLSWLQGQDANLYLASEYHHSQQSGISA